MYNIRYINFKNKKEAEKFLWEMGVDETGIKLMAPKAVFQCIKLDDVPVRAAHILKQEMLSIGGEAAVIRGVVSGEVEKTPVLLMGTYKHYNKLIKKLKMQPFKLKQLSEHIIQVLNNAEPQFKPLEFAGFSLPIDKRTIVMGILNITPDSFSDGGKYYDINKAVEHAHEMVENGADIIDIGAESTRPGYTYVDPEEEIRRLLPVLEKLLVEIKKPISVDTYKAVTAEKVLELGVHIINDQWGLKYDHKMAEVVAKYNVPVIIMHNQEGTNYYDLMGDIIAWLRESINIAEEAGINPDNIIVDPGIGFGKTLEHNLEVMNRLDELHILGKPILLGTSKKSLIGKTLDLPVDERMEGTAATVALGIAKGVHIVRIHDVKEMSRVCKMMDAMIRR